MCSYKHKYNYKYKYKYRLEQIHDLPPLPLAQTNMEPLPPLPLLAPSSRARLKWTHNYQNFSLSPLSLQSIWIPITVHPIRHLICGIFLVPWGIQEMANIEILPIIPCNGWKLISVTRRSRSDESHLLTEWAFSLTLLMWPWWVMIPLEDFTDVILFTLMALMKVI